MRNDDDEQAKWQEGLEHDRMMRAELAGDYAPPKKPERKYQYVALDMHVLIVAIENGIDWSAYIGAVPGQCHEKEFMNVAENGTKIPQKVAEYYFHRIAERLPWRD